MPCSLRTSVGVPQALRRSSLVEVPGRIAAKGHRLDRRLALGRRQSFVTALAPVGERRLARHARSGSPSLRAGVITRSGFALVGFHRFGRLFRGNLIRVGLDFGTAKLAGSVAGSSSSVGSSSLRLHGGIGGRHSSDEISERLRTRAASAAERQRPADRRFPRRQAILPTAK